MHYVDTTFPARSTIRQCSSHMVLSVFPAQLHDRLHERGTPGHTRKGTPTSSVCYRVLVIIIANEASAKGATMHNIQDNFIMLCFIYSSACRADSG